MKLRLRTPSAPKTAGALSLVPLLLTAPPAPFARTWIVRVDHAGDAPTIQAGIDSAAVGDTVIVQGGRYQENIDFKGKDIVLRGAGAGVTYIEGYKAKASCVKLISGEGRGAVLEGFTIARGPGQPWPGGPATLPVGGGVLILDAEPTIRGNDIRDNEAQDFATTFQGYGGGVYCAGSSRWSPLIEGNIIRDNIAGGNGGGIGVDGSIAPIIRDNEIRGNRTSLGDGGGIWVYANNHGTVIQHNRIEGNIALDHGGGILFAFTQAGSGAVIAYNLIVNNRAEALARAQFGGGGLFLYGGTNLRVYGNTLSGNRSDGPDATWGGGIAVVGTGSPVIEQNIIAYSAEGGGIRCESRSSPLIRNNLAWQNLGGDGNGTCADWWSKDGNAAVDPMFCNPSAGDYTVAQASPALTHPAGPIGAFETAGCIEVPVEPTTWGRIKAVFR